MRRWTDKLRIALAALPLALLLPHPVRASSDGYSTLTQIRPDNLPRLRQVWRLDVPGDALQTTPLVIDGIAYLMTPDQSVLAVEGDSGRVLWTFAEGAGGSQPVRGLASWSDGRQRILYASQGTDLVALDATSGRPVTGFGTAGRVDLRRGLGRDPRSVATFLTSPAVVWRDLVIVGFRTSESLPAAPGAIRAYDARTGRLRWMFRALPRTQGGGNAWAGLAVDDARGILYVNANDIAWTGGLVASPPPSAPGTGAAFYQQHCATCHGVERQDQPPAFPALDDIGSRWLDWQIQRVIVQGKGRSLWQVPLDEYPELIAQGHSPTGTENYGGPLVTASGLVFIGASVYDRQLRAFDAASGLELWRTTLPYAGAATPVTYSVSGRQHLLIATSGSRDPKGPQGAAYVAYALDPPTQTAPAP
ncbi:MAG: hypothetical protein RL026_366 [Pseudomonadota bacterium]